MPKNPPAAKVRAGGKAQDLTSSDVGGSAVKDSTVQEQSAAGTQAAGAGSLGSAGQPENTSAPDLSLATNQVAGSNSTDAGSQLTGSIHAVGLVTAGPAGTGLQASHLGDSSGKSSTDGVVGTGESFDKMLADSFRSTHGLKVTSSQAGFRRAGRAWSTTPTVIALSELTDDEIRMLKGEPLLSVQLVDLEDEDF